AVFQAVEAKINEVRRNRVIDGHAEGANPDVGRAMLPQERESVLVHPRGMAKFDRVTVLGRKLRQESAETLAVHLVLQKVWRQLPEDRAGLLGQRHEPSKIFF